MKKTVLVLVIVLVLSALILTACGGGGTSSNQPVVPADYASKTNPLSGADAEAAGQVIYAERCASCHGDMGNGDGPVAGSLNPKPAKLSDVVAKDSDAYLYWRIAEGGVMDPFNSSMPAHKAVLSEEQIWQVVTFLKTFK
ncbi:MAG: cytochrome c [Longilinea sp.]|nr:cytochrome c [Longilinea sp.]